MGSKITIIGAGSVGSTIAHILSLKPYVSELVMIDILKDKADGEIMDMAQGTGFRDPISMISGDYEDAAGSDIVIVTSGVARKPGQTRIELAKTNVAIMKSIAPQVAKHAPNALCIIVANPVDVLTYAFLKYSGMKESQVIGSGTLLDTVRLTYKLSQELGIAQRSIKGYVFGEHGDTSFIPWSMVTVEGIKLDEYTKGARRLGIDANDFDPDEVITYVRKSGGEIIKRKGATFYGVANSVVDVCEALMGAQDLVTVVSSMMHGEYGISGISLSMPAIVGLNGIETHVPISLDADEAEKLRESAETLKKIAAELDLSTVIS